MTDKERAPGGDSQGPKVAPSPSAPIGMLPDRAGLVSLDPDLWLALAALDRVLGADQVTVLRVFGRAGR